MRRYIVMAQSSKVAPIRGKGAQKGPAAKTKKQPLVQGAALAPVMDTIKIGEKWYKLTFSNRTFRHIEDVYREQYGRTVGIPTVLAELGAVSYAATMAVFYAAILAADNPKPPTWAEFETQFQFTDLPGVQAKLAEMVDKAIPEQEPDQKNG